MGKEIEESYGGDFDCTHNFCFNTLNKSDKMFRFDRWARDRWYLLSCSLYFSASWGEKKKRKEQIFLRTGHACLEGFPIKICHSDFKRYITIVWSWKKQIEIELMGEKYIYIHMYRLLMPTFFFLPILVISSPDPSHQIGLVKMWIELI